MFFKQILWRGDNFSYIIADKASHKSAVVDSSFNVEEILRILKAEDLQLKYIISTHGHPDHTAGNYDLRAALGGEIVAHALSRIRADIKVGGGSILNVGVIKIQVIYTPGHTTDSICLLVNGKKLLTGDTLFVGECGRTDLLGGNPRSLYDSLFNKLLNLDNDIEVYPGHDYGPKHSSTIGEQRRTNYVLQSRSVDEFVEFMREP